MKGETSIVYHARFEAEVSPQVKLWTSTRHADYGSKSSIVIVHVLPHLTLIPRVFSTKLRDPAVPSANSIHKLTFQQRIKLYNSINTAFFLPLMAIFPLLSATRRSPPRFLSSRNTSSPFWNTTSATPFESIERVEMSVEMIVFYSARSYFNSIFCPFIATPR